MDNRKIIEFQEMDQKFLKVAQLVEDWENKLKNEGIELKKLEKLSKLLTNNLPQDLWNPEIKRKEKTEEGYNKIYQNLKEIGSKEEIVQVLEEAELKYPWFKEIELSPDDTKLRQTISEKLEPSTLLELEIEKVENDYKNYCDNIEKIERWKKLSGLLQNNEDRMSAVKSNDKTIIEDGYIDLVPRIEDFFNSIEKSITVKGKNSYTINSEQKELLKRLVNNKYAYLADSDFLEDRHKSNNLLVRLFCEHIINSIPKDDELSNNLIKKSEELKEKINEINPVFYGLNGKLKKATSINLMIDNAVFSYLSENAYEKLAEEAYEVLKEELEHYFTPNRERKEEIIGIIKEGWRIFGWEKKIFNFETTFIDDYDSSIGLNGTKFIGGGECEEGKFISKTFCVFPRISNDGSQLVPAELAVIEEDYDTPENREKVKLTVGVRQTNNAINKLNDLIKEGEKIKTLTEGEDFSELEIKAKMLAKFEQWALINSPEKAEEWERQLSAYKDIPDLVERMHFFVADKVDDDISYDGERSDLSDSENDSETETWHIKDNKFEETKKAPEKPEKKDWGNIHSDFTEHVPVEYECMLSRLFSSK